jgi:zinc protease
MLKLNFFAWLLACAIPVFGQQAANLTAPVPLDPEVRTGVLENGMTYFIRSNQEPKERASFYIIQNVGAILENDDQNGLAHFLEHMAFNGTKHFPGKGIIETLERHGVAFGRNINAYTSQDETVYNISDVPVGPEGLMDTCLLVLHDWSNYLLLTDEEIDAERGVISEEWRTRRNAGFRLRNEYMPAVANYSKYAYRDVIGDLDVIKNFEYETLRQFYHDWYRTDLQAIAVVGDFDAEEMEKKVIKLFSSIPAVSKAKERYEVEIPSNSEPLFKLATDKEATNARINYYIRHETTPADEKNHQYLRDGYMRQLASMMINTRISELLQTGTPPFINGGIGYGNFTRKHDVFYISATAKENEEALAFRAILTESERARRYGFTPGELERAKANLLTGFENALKQKEKIKNDSYCREFKSLYIDGVPAPGIDYEYQFANQVVPGIMVEEVSAQFMKNFTNENQVVFITGPDKEGIQHLSEEETFAIMNEVAQDATIQAYVDEEVSSNLVSDEIQVGTIVATKNLPDMGAVEWTLSNDVKVIYRYANYNKEKVALSSYSKGGSSLYEVEDLPSARMAGEMMGMFGIGDYNAVALKKALTGKSVNVGPTIGSLSEGLSGNCRTQDFETMLQLVYLHFEQPRFDEEAFNTYLARYKAYLANMGDDPGKTMSDSLTMIMSNYHPRTLLFDEDYLEQVTFDQVKRIYQERFANPADFIFFIVGDVEEETVRQMASKYLGAIQTDTSRENWVDHNENGPEGELKKSIPVKMTTPKATVNINYNTDMEYIPENRIALSMISAILRLRYTESIREKEGGTYGVSVRSSFSHFPKPEGSLSIRFDTDPERKSDLIPLVYKEIDLILENGPTQEDLDKTRKNMLKSRAEQKENNGYWMGVVYNYYIHGENSDLPVNYEDIVNNMSVETLKDKAQLFFNNSDKVEVVFVPKETE